MGPRRILIVEDNRADVYLIREAIESTAIRVEVQVATDGEEAIRLIQKWKADEKEPCPDLVLLDINLPRKSGAEVLRHLRSSERCRETVVMVVSTSDSPQDREKMMALGADRYFRKPSEYEDFLKLGGVIAELLEGKSPRADH